jgi:hypothetical protein
VSAALPLFGGDLHLRRWLFELRRHLPPHEFGRGELRDVRARLPARLAAMLGGHLRRVPDVLTRRETGAS